MEKIVIISSQPDKDLIALLNMLFPDCEIRVASSRIEALEEALASSSEVMFQNINPNVTPKVLRDKGQSLLDIKPPEGE